VDCVDQFCSELKAAGRKAEIKVLDAKGILHPPAVAKSQKLSKSANSKTSASKTSANSDPLYYQGWYSGVHFKFEGKMAETPQTNDPEWFRGFLDGAEFASEHGAQK
jgi:hypothetical protein